MPLVYPSKIVSFSSEDNNHPASNLLNRDTFRKWKCRDVGKKEAFVIFKFDKCLQFTGIDIGNECSAMIEVLVGRSGGDADVKYEVLLSSSVLMSPTDSRNLHNPSGVRTYTTSQFDRETMVQKWDLVKVVVSQIFNKQTQFGLTFVKFTAVADPDAPKKIGAFTLRKPLGSDDDMMEDEKEPARIGAFFAKSLADKAKAQSQSIKGSEKEENSTNAAIRKVISAISGAAQSSSESKVKEVLKKNKPDASLLSPTTSSGSPRSSGSGTTSKSDKLPNRNTLEDKRQKSNQDAQPQATPKSPNSSSSKSNKVISNGRQEDSGTDDEDESEPPTNKPRKPFNKLFEGVVFVMSGFENPYRKSLRDRALEMGAKCKPNWDSTCTHLICAFHGTPKFHEVRRYPNGGKIVRKEWVERSYGARCRFPWRRFCLDRNDKGTESEEEIEAESEQEEENQLSDAGQPQETEQPQEDSATPSTSTASKDVRTDDDGDDDDIPSPKKKRKRMIFTDEEDESDGGTATEESKKKKQEIYDTDTDIDEPVSEQEKKNASSPKQVKKKVSDSDTDFEEESISEGNNNNEDKGSFFQNSVFFLSSWPKGDPQNEKDQIEQIICKRKGKIATTLSEDVEYLVTNEKAWNEQFSEALSENPNLNIVHSDWILKCESEKMMTSADEFMITP